MLKTKYSKDFLWSSVFLFFISRSTTLVQ